MRTIDLVVIVIYLAAVVAAGILCRGRGDSVDEYFTARGMFRGPLGTLLVGLSIAATFFSGISLIAYISSAFSNGAQIVMGLLGLPAAWAVLHFWFLPRYLAGRWRHPYEIIEARFGPGLRLLLSAMFVLLRIGWMGVLVYAPTLIIMGTVGLGPEWFWPIVLVVGLSSTCYTVVGGIRGVIVTDAIQFFVIAAGMLFIAVFILCKLDLTAGAMWRELHDAGRLQLLNFSLDPTQAFTFWGVLLGVGVSNLGSYLADQMSLQRYLASETVKEATRSFLINIIGAIGIVVTLVCTGLLLWLWYQHNPDPHRPAEADRVVSYFIARELPVGMSGLLIAAILAATMSSMTSGINALAGALTNDWLARFARERSPAAMLRFGRRASIGIGVLSTLSAGIVAHLGPILQASQVVMGAFLGPMLACMMLAVSKLSVRPAHVFAGVVAGAVAGWLVALTPASGLWVSPVSFVVAASVPLVGCLFGRRA